MNAKDTIDIQVSFGMDLEADDVLQLLGVVPKDGLCEFGLYDILSGKKAIKAIQSLNGLTNKNTHLKRGGYLRSNYFLMNCSFT